MINKLIVILVFSSTLYASDNFKGIGNMKKKDYYPKVLQAAQNCDESVTINGLSIRILILIAAENDYFKIIRAYMRCKGIPEKFGSDVLKIALQQENTKVIQLLQDKIKLSPQEVERSLHERLLSSIRVGNLQKAKSLIAAGANINYASDKTYGETPLMVASTNYQEHIVKHLLKSGVNIDYASSCGLTALLFALSYTREKEVTAIEKRNKVHMARVLINAGAKVNVSNDCPDTGGSALSIASSLGEFELVKLLVRKGARAELADLEYDYSATRAAVSSGNFAIVRYLLRHGGGLVCLKPRPTDKRFETELDVAAKQSVSIVPYLLKKGCKPDGYTFYSGVLGAVKHKYPNGSGIRVPEKGRQLEQRISMLKLLFKANPNVNLNPYEGETLLDMAQHNEVPKKIIDLLLKHGATEAK